jgi:transcriptional regulator with XRE-family HTH domain
MAKSKERLIARSLRKQGLSLKTIAKCTGVSKSSVSLWVRDIILSIEQLETLRKQNIQGSERGRLIGALKQKNERMKRIKNGEQEGKALFSTLAKKELLIAGCALYWAEGTKKQRKVSFCNSDPKLIEFMITWLKLCFAVSAEEFSCYIGINEIHKKRENIVKQYWSDITGISLTQFTKTSFKQIRNKKIYDNFNEHFGTLTVTVRRPAQLYYRIMGMIEGMRQSKKPG